MWHHEFSMNFLPLFKFTCLTVYKQVVLVVLKDVFSKKVITLRNNNVYFFIV